MPRGGVNADMAALKAAVGAKLAEKPLVLACPWGLGNRARALVAAVHHLRGQHRELLLPCGQDCRCVIGHLAREWQDLDTGLTQR